MDPHRHKRYLDYRERHGYFGSGAKLPLLGPADFEKSDSELEALEAKGQGRDDEEEHRLGELLRLLLRD